MTGSLVVTYILIHKTKYVLFPYGNPSTYKFQKSVPPFHNSLKRDKYLDNFRVAF